MLGRGAEHALLAQVGVLATSRGCTAVRVGLVASARNAPLVSFLERSAALVPYLPPSVEAHRRSAAVLLGDSCDGGGGGGGGSGEGGGGDGEALVSDEAWAAARPQRWFYFSADLLRNFRYG